MTVALQSVEQCCWNGSFCVAEEDGKDETWRGHGMTWYGRYLMLMSLYFPSCWLTVLGSASFFRYYVVLAHSFVSASTVCV